MECPRNEDIDAAQVVVLLDGVGLRPMRVHRRQLAKVSVLQWLVDVVTALVDNFSPIEVRYFGGIPLVPIVACIRQDLINLHSINYAVPDRKSTRLNSSHLGISYAVFCLKKKK